ncbi:MAG: Copper methylamine oxidase [Chroococcidiopsis cubana SAG 39.79]|uniref:Amine oxidase n=1 Tax=Chroococcidiopsis cubana SAG 39.79 TaxID=388085 RepID=A0AB37UPK1_9CYAN|nr:Copper methylamine oxidase [Chroococcidiopsis cubana SAG 39.79]PSB66460.1 tyramine oxidase [Chroococcidiopsis cubana CCALA 043]RUT13107.1 amine oxidase [Chroococcidiopsis cubana SAG 39.79]
MLQILSQLFSKRRKQFWLSIAMFIVVAIAISSIQISLARIVTPTHPLDSLTAQEITAAVALIKQKMPQQEIHFPIVALNEPDKTEVLNFKPGQPFKREVFAVVYDRSQNKTYEAVVTLKPKTKAKAAVLSSWQEIPGVQPAIMEPEYEIAAAVTKADPRWQAAMRKRGITDFKQVVVEGWAVGLVTEAEKSSGARLCRTLSYFKGDRWNYYGTPIEGVVATVDLNAKKLASFSDTGVVALSKENWDYDRRSLSPLRTAAKLLKILQPNGHTFKLSGNEVSWQGWKFRYMMHPRDGLILYQVQHEDGREFRPVMYRASLSEMVVPYGDPNPQWSFRNAFDVGEYNFGTLTNTQELGKEVPENGVLLDAVLADSQGKPYAMPDVVGIYEKDNGVLWKHYDYRSERKDVRRDRQLIVTTTATIGNYDYAINWIFHQDGSLDVRTDLHGLVLAQGSDSVTTASRDSYGKLIAKNIVGVNHQHFFNFRLDLDVDGEANMPMEMTVQSLPISANNPHGNAFVTKHVPLTSEESAVRDLNMTENREWAIASTTRKNQLGAPTSYMLMPSGNTVFFPRQDATIRDRAGFATHHFWVTKYKPKELHAGGEYPNQSNSQQGLPTLVADNEPLIGQDLVAWYTFGTTHVPRPEDWPVMPVHHAGFKLMPVGFFTRNPAINLPESTPINHSS